MIILMSFGAALTFIETIDFKYISNINETKNVETKTTYIEIDDKTEISFLKYSDTEIIIDNNQKDLKVEITFIKDVDVKLRYYQNEKGNDYFFINYYNDYLIDDFKFVINMLKNKEWYNDLGLVGIKLYVSEDNLKMLEENR